MICIISNCMPKLNIKLIWQQTNITWYSLWFLSLVFLLSLFDILLYRTAWANMVSSEGYFNVFLWDQVIITKPLLQIGMLFCWLFLTQSTSGRNTQNVMYEVKDFNQSLKAWSHWVCVHHVPALPWKRMQPLYWGPARKKPWLFFSSKNN